MGSLKHVGFWLYFLCAMCRVHLFLLPQSTRMGPGPEEASASQSGFEKLHDHSVWDLNFFLRFWKPNVQKTLKFNIFHGSLT